MELEATAGGFNYNNNDIFICAGSQNSNNKIMFLKTGIEYLCLMLIVKGYNSL